MLQLKSAQFCSLSLLADHAHCSLCSLVAYLQVSFLVIVFNQHAFDISRYVFRRGLPNLSGCYCSLRLLSVPRASVGLLYRGRLSASVRQHSIIVHMAWGMDGGSLLRRLQFGDIRDGKYPGSMPFLLLSA